LFSLAYPQFHLDSFALEYSRYFQAILLLGFDGADYTPVQNQTQYDFVVLCRRKSAKPWATV
jgi:hypothetical protein